MIQEYEEAETTNQASLKAVAIDFTQAFSRFGKNSELYSEVVNQFFASYGQLDTQLTPMLLEKGPSDTARWLHGVKGSAMVLGFDSLAVTLQAVEKAILQEKELSTLLLEQQYSEHLQFQITTAKRCVQAWLQKSVS